MLLAPGRGAGPCTPFPSHRGIPGGSLRNFSFCNRDVVLGRREAVWVTSVVTKPKGAQIFLLFPGDLAEK